MSDAKRDNCEFRFTAAGRAPRRPRLPGAASPPAPTPTAVELRLVEPWEQASALGGDPYNAVGARTTRA